MERQYYINLANTGLRMPIGADLILHKHDNHQEILVDGQLLGRVLEETAQHFNTPLAVPRMDLELEKHDILRILGIPAEERAKFHFEDVPGKEVFETLAEGLEAGFSPALQAHIDSITYIANETELLPIGMAIGPFSLMTKLVPDPITPVCMAGTGLTGEDDDEIKTIEEVLELGTRFILKYVEAQINAGAKAIFIAEPAANKVYFSPNQIEDGSDIFDRYAMTFNRQIKALLDAHGVDLIFHCCGELTEYMVKKFTELDPAIMSLGSSRKLWEDAAIVPKTTVLYGNLPSKKFYSDGLITVEQVKETGCELLCKMRDAGHPFILGTECDVLIVPGCEQEIMSKAEAVMECGEHCTCGAC